MRGRAGPVGRSLTKPMPPLIGITADVVSADPLGPQQQRLRAVAAMTYVDAVADAGGVPIVLPAVPGLAAEHARVCDGLVLTGGADPRMEAFGRVTHARATCMNPQRQAYETALLAALEARAEKPVLGICLGMQMMALHAGGDLCQHLPDVLASAARHAGDTVHGVQPTAVVEGRAGTLAAGGVTSNHHQAVSEPGSLRVLAKSDDGVIEAVDDPARRFYLGVQWHPERTSYPPLGLDLFRRLVRAAADRAG